METLRSPSVDPNLLDKIGDIARLMKTVLVESLKLENIRETTHIELNMQTGHIRARPESQVNITKVPLKFPQSPSNFPH